MWAFELYYGEIVPVMTLERAKRIRYLRIDLGHSLQTLSETIHKEWGKDATWPKSGDVDAGEALCVLAARKLGETPYKDPW